MSDELLKIMSRYMDAQRAKEILLEGSDFESLFQLQDRHITFVLIEFTAKEEVALLADIASVTTLSSDHSAVISSIVSNLMVVVFGMIGPITPYQPFVDAVLAKHRDSVKIVYATGNARIGNIGNAKRMGYTFLSPSFSKALALLPSIPVGEAREIV